MSPEERLLQLGYAIHPPPRAAALYQLCSVQQGWVYVSGCLPLDTEQRLLHPGKLGTSLSIAEGQAAASLCSVNVLRILKAELGELDRVEQIVRVGGYVNCAPDFSEVHLVVNGASELLVESMGAKGAHARSAIGVASLPLGASVEIDAVVKVKA